MKELNYSRCGDYYIPGDGRNQEFDAIILIISPLTVAKGLSGGYCMRMRQQNSTSTLRLDPERSIRSQIAGYYRDRIVRGELRPGDRLPPARTLARELGVAEANVHHAFGKLAGEGLLIRRPRAGSVVARREPGLRGVAVFVPWRSLMRGEEFTRLLVRFLAARFEESGVECHVLYDTPGGTGWNGLRRLAFR